MMIDLDKCKYVLFGDEKCPIIEKKMIGQIAAQVTYQLSAFGHKPEFVCWFSLNTGEHIMDASNGKTGYDHMLVEAEEVESVPETQMSFSEGNTKLAREFEELKLKYTRVVEEKDTLINMSRYILGGVEDIEQAYATFEVQVQNNIKYLKEIVDDMLNMD
jgi:hypothetical protein